MGVCVSSYYAKAVLALHPFTMVKVLAFSLPCVLTLALGACTNTSAPSPSSLDPSAFEQLKVDEATGTFELPLDPYIASLEEDHVIQYAVDLRIRECMKALGQEYVAYDMRTATPRENRRFGPWSMELAASYGYGLPPSPSEYRGAETGNSEIHDEQWDSDAIACGKKNTDLALPNKRLDGASLATYEETLASPDGVRALNEWRECLRDSGIRPPEDGWVPADAQGVNKSVEIRVAVADVDCKARVRLVPRLASIEAEIQTRYIAEHESELFEYRQQVDKVLETAQQVISANGG